MLSENQRGRILDIVDRLDSDDARFLVQLMAHGQVCEAALVGAEKQLRRFRRRLRRVTFRIRKPIPTIGMN